MNIIFIVSCLIVKARESPCGEAAGPDGLVPQEDTITSHTGETPVAPSPPQNIHMDQRRCQTVYLSYKSLIKL